MHIISIIFALDVNSEHTTGSSDPTTVKEALNSNNINQETRIYDARTGDDYCYYSETENEDLPTERATTIQGLLPKERITAVQGSSQKQRVTSVQRSSPKETVNAVQGSSPKERVTAIQGSSPKQTVTAVQGSSPKQKATTVQGSCEIKGLTFNSIPVCE